VPASANCIHKSTDTIATFRMVAQCLPQQTAFISCLCNGDAVRVELNL